MPLDSKPPQRRTRLGKVAVAARSWGLPSLPPSGQPRVLPKPLQHWKTDGNGKRLVVDVATQPDAYNDPGSRYAPTQLSDQCSGCQRTGDRSRAHHQAEIDQPAKPSR